jgi:putative ABC transport system substrate-binding protein
MQFELIGKRLEVLKEAVPGLTRVALLANTGHPGVQEELARSQAAARRLGFTVQWVLPRCSSGTAARRSAPTRPRCRTGY